MAGRCGCGSAAGIQATGRYGVGVQGVGTQQRPLVARFDPRKDQILGNGLTWNEQQKKLSARISTDEDNGLQWGSDGGLWAPTGGSGPSPTPPSGVSVAGLPASDVVAGIDGGGYLLTGDSTLSAYRSALQLGVDATYVPVRALGDGSVVVWPHEDADLARLTVGSGTDHLRPDYSSYTPADLDALAWRQVPLMAGGYRSNSAVDPVTGKSADLYPSAGYFGGGEPPQPRGTFLCDVATEIGTHTVLILHIEQSSAYEGVMEVITNHGLRRSVIVVSNKTEIIETYIGENLEAGLYNDRDYGQLPSPNTIADLGATWALIGRERSDKGFTDFKNAGLNVLMMWARWHSDYERVNNTLGIRGAVTGDPVYYTGPATDYAYRPSGDIWSINFDLAHQKPGWFTPNRKRADNTPLRRPHMGQNGGYWLIDSDATWRTWYPDDAQASDTYGTYYTQVGNVCPIVPGENTDTFKFTVGYSFFEDSGVWTNNHAIAIAFGVPTDHAFCDAIDDEQRTDLDVGYVWIEYWDGRIGLVQYNGTEPAKEIASGTAPEGSGSNIYRERSFLLLQDRLIVAHKDGNTAIANGFDTKTPPSYHGGYVYIGKRDYPNTTTGNDGRSRILINRFDVATPWSLPE